MARSNRKDPEYVVVRLWTGNDRLDRTFKAQRFDARTDARTFANEKNARRRDLRKRYTVLPVYPGPVSRKK
ncbi:MAG: hypothetical protein ACREO4_09525 [Lysobacter sp.]